MAAAGRDVLGALLTWLQTFAPPSPCATPQDLTDGVALAYVLHSIDSSWFDETWLGLIRDDAADNGRLKVSNLQRVLQRLLEYWQEVLGRALPEHHLPDVALAAQSAEPEELRRMVRMVLRCAMSGAGGSPTLPHTAPQEPHTAPQEPPLPHSTPQSPPVP
ncbi:protein Hook homolog 2 [Guaruba guarouba]